MSWFIKLHRTEVKSIANTLPAKTLCCSGLSCMRSRAKGDIAFPLTHEPDQQLDRHHALKTWLVHRVGLAQCLLRPFEVPNLDRLALDALLMSDSKSMEDASKHTFVFSINALLRTSLAVVY
jgi:hypothetical protein